MSKFILFLMFVFSGTMATKAASSHHGRSHYIPSYIKPCSVSAPDFAACCLEHGRDAIPSLLKGDRKLGIPNLLPLNVPYIEVDAGKELTIYFMNMKAFGLEGIDLKAVKIDTKSKKITLKMNVPKLELVGQYKVDGKLLILPIKGEGDINITAIGGKYQYEFEYTLNKIKGEDYLTMTTKDKLDFDLENALFKLDNLFNGDEMLGKQMNNFLNDNWRDVIGELGGAVSQTVGALDAEPADFERAISTCGYGKFNIALYILSAAAGWPTVFETTAMSYVFPAAECDLELTLGQKGSLNAVTYAGMISSAFIWGYLCDALGRKKLLFIGLLLDGMFFLMAATSQTFQLLMVSKFLGGFIINGPFAALTAYLSEFHCAKDRARVQMILGTIFSMGNLILPVLAIFVLPLKINLQIGDLVFHSWNIYLMIMALPALVSGIAFIFLPESPKFLMAIGDNKQALEVFRKVYSINMGLPEEEYPIRYLVNETDKETSDMNGSNDDVRVVRSKREALREGMKNIRPIFSSPYFFKIILVFIIQFMIMMSLNTLRLWLPQIYKVMYDYQYKNDEDASLCGMLEIFQPNNKTLNATITCQVAPDNIQVYTNSMIVAVTSIVGYIMAGTLINSIGKKTLLSILGLVSGLVAMTMYFSRNVISTIALSAMFVTFGSIGINVILAVVVDLIPTSLRAMTVSLTMMFGRLGAALGNIVFPFLLESGCAPPFFSVGSVMLGCAFLAHYLPDTDMKALL